MATPHTCPVCHGEGYTQMPPQQSDWPEQWYDQSAGAYRCRACDGTGIVWEPAMPRVVEQATVVEPVLRYNAHRGELTDGTHLP